MHECHCAQTVNKFVAHGTEYVQAWYVQALHVLMVIDRMQAPWYV